MSNDGHDNRDRLSLKDAFEDLPEVQPETDFRSQLMERIERDGLMERERRLSTTGRVLVFGLLIFVFGVLPYAGSKYYSHITGHEAYIAEISREASEKREQARHLSKQVHARFNYTEETVPGWAPHYYMTTDRVDPKGFFSEVFTRYHRGELDRGLIRSFYQQSNVFHDAYIKYDLSGNSLTSSGSSPVIVFDRNLPNRFTLRIMTEDLRELRPVLEDVLGPAAAVPEDAYSGVPLTPDRLEREPAIVSFLTVRFE